MVYDRGEIRHPARATGASCRARSARAPPVAVVNADRVLADLRELARLTGGPGRRAARLLDRRVDEGARVPALAAGRAAGRGRRRRGRATSGPTWRASGDGFVIVGSHVDSVPAGGWLDGALGDVHRARGAAHARPRAARRRSGLRLVDWADEEGARFGRSLFGSSACAGTLDADEVRDLRDRDGERLEDVVARYDVELDRAHESGARAARRARLPRAAHRAGPGAREQGRAGGDRARHLRRRAPPRGVHRPRPRTPAPRRCRLRRDTLHGHRAGGARDPRGRPRARRASAPSAARPASRAW